MPVIRRSLQIVAFICTLVIGMASMAIIVTQTAWFKEWLRTFIVRQAANYLNGELSIGRMNGNLFFGVELEDVGLTLDGQPVVEIADVGIDYNAFSFVRGHVVLDDIRLNRPVLRLERTDEGWNIARLVKVRTPQTPQRRRLPIDIGEIGISSGTVYLKDRTDGPRGVNMPARIGRLDASLALTSNENALTVSIAHVSLRAERPHFDVNAISGTITRTADHVTFENMSLRTEESALRVDGSIETGEQSNRPITVRASSDVFVTDEIGRLVPALGGFGLRLAFEVAAHGPVERLSVDVSVREPTLGKTTGDLQVDAAGPDRHVAGTVAMTNFNFGPLVARRPPHDRDAEHRPPPRTPFTSDITGTARIDLALPKDETPLNGTYALDAERVIVAGYDAQKVVGHGRIDGRVVDVDGSANAYGGRTAVRGTFVIQRPVVLDLAGEAAGVNLEKIPPTLKVPAVPTDLQFTWTLNARDGEFTGTADFGASTAIGASIEPGTTGRMTFGRGAPDYEARGQVVNLDLQQVGREFGFRVLEEDRFRSQIDAGFDVKGSGGGRYPFTLDGTGTAVDSTIFGASFPRLDVGARFADGDMRARAEGVFTGLDPAVPLVEKEATGNLNGSLDVDVTLRDFAAGFTIDTFDVEGRVDLTSSTMAKLAIDAASIEGWYARREGVLARFELTGPDLSASGHGTIALNETGATALEVHATSTALDRVGAAIGRPLTGRASLDATVTGNARELKLQGALEGTSVGYGPARALTLASTLEMTVPRLTLPDATIAAASTATFVEIGGRSIRELTAETTFAGSQLEFNAVAREGERELAAVGSAVLHPDHQEVHLGSVALRSGDVEWRTVPGSASAVRVAGNRVEVRDLQLASGDQRIDASGVIGSTTEALQVRADNVDVAELDRLVLGDERFAGRLNADVRIFGPLDAARAEGRFALTQGAFRQFMFESLTGAVDYAQSRVNVDVVLQESPQAWLRATGVAPISMFRPGREPMGGHETPTAGEGIDLQITSSQIDLGLIQGFTPYVTNVTGVVQADVRVTGTGRDPHFIGAIDVRGGSFAVPELGTAYTGLDTRVDLMTDSVAISEMRIVDRQNQVMTIGGNIAVHERAVGAVDLTVRSEGFEVVNNDLADLKLDTDIRVTGELRAPRVQGFVEVATGSVDIARVMEETAPDPYGAKVGTPSAATQSVPGVAPTPTLFQAIELEVGVGVPGNLVLRGNDIRPNNAAISVGDLNVTVGGAIQVLKAPGARPRYFGEINTIRGSYTFQGRRFEILRDGRIRFDGSEMIDPLVDIQARRVISGVETLVRVHGSMRMPELAFSSRPPLDEADILSLIIFNVPINELGLGQQVSLAERAGALAGGYLVSGLTQSLADALRLDELEFQTQTTGGLGATLSIGEQIGDNLFVRVRRGFGAAEAIELILEYQITDYLRLQGNIAQTPAVAHTTFQRVERGGIDLIFFFSY